MTVDNVNKNKDFKKLYIYIQRNEKNKKKSKKLTN